MHLRRLKVLGVVVPAAGLFAFELLRHVWLQPALGEPAPHLEEHIVSAAVLAVAVVAFSFTIFRLLERLHGQLVALNEAGIAVTGDLSVDPVLERVVELARKVADASYASVQVERAPARAVSSGQAPGSAPRLVLPVVVKGQRLGQLVLAGPRGRRFRGSDREALEIFATQVGIALENAHLFEQVQELVATRERVRIGMDLHDGVIQELYALGLKVEDAAELVGVEPETAASSMRETQRTLQGVIGEIRAYVYGLRDGDSSVDLRPVLERLVEELPPGPPSIALEAADEPRLPAAQAANVMHIVREAVTNALRHAKASHVRILVSSSAAGLDVSVTDDGRGFDPRSPSSGFGMSDMRERARWCRGRLDVTSQVGRGASVRISVPANEPIAGA